MRKFLAKFKKIQWQGKPLATVKNPYYTRFPLKSTRFFCTGRYSDLPVRVGKTKCRQQTVTPEII